MLRILRFLPFLLGGIAWGLAQGSSTPIQSTKNKTPSPQPPTNQPSPIQESQDTSSPKVPSTALTNPPKVSSKDTKRTWVLSGFGLGIANKSFNSTNHFNRLYSSFFFNLQVGALTMWDRYFGLQYYYNVDLSTSDLFKNKRTQECSQCKLDVLTRTISSSLNVDAVLNAYNSDRFGIGFIVGLGGGFDVYSYRGVQIEPSHSYKINSTAFGFDLRANLGLRFIFGKSFALSLNCALPFWTYSLNTLSNHHNAYIFTTRFTYGRF